ncbi:MAG: YCF48-related protein [Amphritea sp.]
MKKITRVNLKKLAVKPVVSALFAASVFVCGANSSAAGYEDPLDLPAVAMASAPHSLLLDVTQAGNRLVAVGERGHILFSDNKGESWIQAEVSASTQLNAIFFSDAQRGWVVGEDALIMNTIDGGQSWQKQFDARDAEMKGPLLDLYFKNADEGFAIGVFNKLYHTVDGGKSWQEWQEHADNLDEWHFFAMASPAENTLYITSESGLLFRSLNGGDSFVALQTDHEGSFHGVLTKRGGDGLDRIILSGVGGKLFTSVDGGDSWKELDTHTDAGLSGGTWLADGSALIVGADGILLHITADLDSVRKSQRDNGLPLSGVTVTENGGLILVGLGGIQTLKAGEVK